MKLQDLFVPLAMAFLVTWGMQYFFITRHLPQETAQTVRSGQSFQVPTHEQLLKALNTEVDFSDQQLEIKPEFKEITTPLGHYKLSTAGAVFSTMSFEHKVNAHSEQLQTLDVQPSQHEAGAFLVAVDTATPYAYTLDSINNSGGALQLIYNGNNQDCVIQKQFIVHEDTNKIDLIITIDPRAGKTITPRIFIPAPVMQGADAKTISGFVLTEQDSIKRYKPAELEHTAWATPAIIGTEDRYFIHALVADQDHFVGRAYYKVGGDTRTLILEGPAISQKQTFKLSFYCGPKRLENMQAVDYRLTETLDYGWVAPFSRVLLFLLKYIYSYVHNFGWAIILLTLLLRLIMLPFTSNTEQAGLKRAEYNRKVQYIEQKYRHDKEKLAQEKMDLMRKHGMPDAMGCLPNLLYLPVIIAFNRVLNNSIDLYHAPFGWIHDLSARDPYYILPVCIGLGLLLQAGDSNDPRQRVAMFIMSLFIIGVTAQISAGLALFFAVSSLAAVGQSYLVKFFKRR